MGTHPLGSQWAPSLGSPYEPALGSHGNPPPWEPRAPTYHLRQNQQVEMNDFFNLVSIFDIMKFPFLLNLSSDVILTDVNACLFVLKHAYWKKN